MSNKIIQIICPDKRGIIARITSLIHKSNGNINSIEQHVDKQDYNFYIRLVVSNEKKEQFPKKSLISLAKKLDGKINIFDLEKKINVAILGTKESEPVYDLFIKNTTKALYCNTPILISNHNTLSFIAKQFSTNFYKINNNHEILNILKKEKIDLIILARYMQIISDNIIDLYKNNIINIHHSFLPAFKGAKPYHQAYKKGVKIIGATGHYANKKLDEGPIITQDIAHINHSHSIKDIIQLGRGIEKDVLYRSVKAHLDHKIIINKNKTIVFK
tara:strand:- start:11906 stop:12724 length:819 start_codon:yes stop_codon:yes gene_type:complete